MDFSSLAANKKNGLRPAAAPMAGGAVQLRLLPNMIRERTFSFAAVRVAAALAAVVIHVLRPYRQALRQIPMLEIPALVQRRSGSAPVGAVQ
jgi:hypothetical protein